MTPSMPIVHVVDDDESFRIALARLLRAAVFEVQHVFCQRENGMHRTGPHVPGLCAPELLRLSSERTASSITAPTTGLGR
jgi:hypothetical protein